MRWPARKAVGTVVATVLMTTLTLTLGVIAFFWASQTFGLQTGAAGVFFQNNSNALMESIVIEDVWFNQTNVAWLTIRNVGGINVCLVAIYFNATSQTSTSPSIQAKGCTAPTQTGIPIGVSAAVTIKVTTGFTWSLTSTQFVYISVATARGTVVREYWSTLN